MTILNDDMKAAEDLACEMEWAVAIRFLREQSGNSLVVCRSWVNQISINNPSSVLAKSWTEYNK